MSDDGKIIPGNGMQVDDATIVPLDNGGSTFSGTDRADSFIGTSGDDYLVSNGIAASLQQQSAGGDAKGNEVIDGRDGSDTAILPGTLGNYTLQLPGMMSYPKGGVAFGDIVGLHNSNGDKVVLRDVERVVFAGETPLDFEQREPISSMNPLPEVDGNGNWTKPVLKEHVATLEVDIAEKRVEVKTGAELFEAAKATTDAAGVCRAEASASIMQDADLAKDFQRKVFAARGDSQVIAQAENAAVDDYLEQAKQEGKIISDSCNAITAAPGAALPTLDKPGRKL